MSSSISQLLKAGLEMHRAGRLREADAYYRTLLKQQPQHPDAWHLLGTIAHQVGKHDVAVGMIEIAIKMKPEVADFYVSCAEAYRAQGKYEPAISRLREALSRRANFPGALVNLGNLYKEMERFEEAAEQYREAISMQPGFAMAHNNLGLILKDTGREEEAIGCFKKAIEIMPGNFEAHNNLGNTFLGLAKPDEAIKHYEQALALKPDYAEARSNLGNALKYSGRPEDAVAHYEQAIAIRPDFAMAHYNLGTVLDELGRPQEAIARFERALAIRPDYAEAHNNLGNALDEVGRHEEAIRHYERAIAIRPDYAEAHRNVTRLKPDPEQAPVLEALLERPSLPEADAIHCHFALGNLFHYREEFGKAFEHYEKGNAIKRKSVVFDADKYSAFIDRLIAVHSRDYIRQTGACGSDSELPVFIVGMPRSGTSLVEQILASHPDVYGAGELAALVHVEEAIENRFEGSMPYPECMSLLDASAAREFARQYLGELEKRSREAKRVTDKLPSNFRRVGLIKTIFPNARIIHCQRNAMDTCTSNFLNYFAYGNEYSFNLDELGRYYLDYQRLMNHWDELFSAEILSVQYEELVTDQEQVSRRMIEYIGLQWDDRCLEFHKNERAVNRFSSRQVRSPVYTRSVERWRRYEQQLAPLAATLNAG
jgi:tetratricopeptide (TPR) repeat protein